MQKLNLNHIPEAPENKDFWVVGTANREGSIDSNSYKKNLAKIGGSLEDMTANMTTEQKMQARKNLGLYYEATEQVEKTVTRSEQIIDTEWVKLSDDVPAKEDISKVIWHGEGDIEYIPGVTTDAGDTLNFSDITNGYRLIASDGGNFSQIFFQVITSGDDAGIYGYRDTGGASLYYNSPVETVSKIDEKFLPINEKELIRHTISTAEPLKRILFWNDLVHLAGNSQEGRYIDMYGVKDSADLESLSKMPVEEGGEVEADLIMSNSKVKVEFKTLKQLIETTLDKIPLDEKPTYTILSDTFRYAPTETAGDTITRAWDLSDFVSVVGVSTSVMDLIELPDAVRQSAPFPIPDDVHYFIQVQLNTASS